MPGLYVGIVLGSIGLILGIIIEICGKFLTVKNNETIEEISEDNIVENNPINTVNEINLSEFNNEVKPTRESKFINFNRNN